MFFGLDLLFGQFLLIWARQFLRNPPLKVSLFNFIFIRNVIQNIENMYMGLGHLPFLKLSLFLEPFIFLEPFPDTVSQFGKSTDSPGSPVTSPLHLIRAKLVQKHTIPFLGGEACHPSNDPTISRHRCHLQARNGLQVRIQL